MKSDGELKGKTLNVRKNGIALNLKIKLADSFWSRFKGLMFKNFLPADEGLLITPCNSVHTFSMRFEIDIIFIDEGGLILAIEHSLPANKVTKPLKGCVKILELAAGTAQKLNFKVGDQLNFNRNK